MNTTLIAPAISPQNKPALVSKSSRKAPIREPEEAESGTFTYALEHAAVQQVPPKSKSSAPKTDEGEKAGHVQTARTQDDPSAGAAQAGATTGSTAGAVATSNTKTPQWFPGIWVDPALQPGAGSNGNLEDAAGSAKTQVVFMPTASGPVVNLSSQPASRQPIQPMIETLGQNPSEVVLNAGVKASPAQPAAAAATRPTQDLTLESNGKSVSGEAFLENTVGTRDIKIESLNTGIKGHRTLAEPGPATMANPSSTVSHLFNGVEGRGGNPAPGAAQFTESNKVKANSMESLMEDNLSTADTENGLQNLEARVHTQTATAPATVSSDVALNQKGTAPLTESRILDQIAQQIPLRLRGERSEITLKLEPESLGRIQMTISTENQQVVVKMMAQTPLVKEMVEANLHLLRDELARHGLKVDQFDVSSGTLSNTANFNHQDRQEERFTGLQTPGARSISVEEEAVVSVFSEKQRLSGGSAIDYFA